MPICFTYFSKLFENLLILLHIYWKNRIAVATFRSTTSAASADGNGCNLQFHYSLFKVIKYRKNFFPNVNVHTGENLAPMRIYTQSQFKFITIKRIIMIKMKKRV